MIPDDPHPIVWTHPFVVGGGLAFVLLFLGKLALGHTPDVRLPALLAVWLLALLVLHACRIEFPAPRAAAACGAVALGVHLLGSGGIEMPAIAQILLVAAALGTAAADADRARWRRWPRAAVLPAGAGLLVVVSAWLTTAALPVLKSQSLLALAEGERNVERASRVFEQAALADPLSPQPLRKLADRWLNHWRTSPAAGDVSFRRAIDFQELAIEADPHNPYVHRDLGVRHLLHYDATGEPFSAERAARALRQAVAGYPGAAAFRAELAIALQGAGSTSEARQQALRALNVDDINRRAGHVDKVLPEGMRQRVQRLAGVPIGGQNR